MLLTTLFLHALRFGPHIQLNLQKIPIVGFFGPLIISLIILTFIPVGYAYQSTISLLLSLSVLYRIDTPDTKTPSSAFAKFITLGFVALGYFLLTNTPTPFVINCFLYIVLLEIARRYILIDTSVTLTRLQSILKFREDSNSRSA
ncbi:MAG TPA: hypothetical protein VFP93_04895 [Gammaproteobacteria bacterium]|nr:hypothetical protein [Gammaproteobacteria bacterium]